VFVDAQSNPVKVARTRSFGAQVELIGRDFDEAHEHAIRHARDTAQTLVTDLVDDMVLVSERALLEAQHDLTSELGVLVEPAGAAAWAACVADSASGSASLIIISGSNVRMTTRSTPSG
jgi:threonine dehydratase